MNESPFQTLNHCLRAIADIETHQNNAHMGFHCSLFDR